MINERKRRVWLAWMAALMLAGWSAGAEEQNLVVNPGFELGQEDTVEGWQKQSGDKEGVIGGGWHRERRQAPADIACYGEFYMRGEDAWQTLVQKVDVKGGQRYEFSCCVKTDVVNDNDTGNTFLWLIYYDKDGRVIMPYDYGMTEATGEWREYRREVAAPAPAGYH